MSRGVPLRGDHVDHLRSGHLAGDPLDLLQVLGSLHEHEICARRGISVGPIQRVVEAVRLDCVRAGDDLEAIVVPCVAGGGDARRELVGLEHFLALEVPAALREHLVLELDRGGARSLVATYGAHDIGGAAEAGVAIDDERKRGGFGESKDVVDHVALRDQPDVGQSEVRERASGAGDVRGGVPGQLDGTRGEPVEDSGRDDQPGPGEQRIEPCRPRLERVTHGNRSFNHSATMFSASGR